MYFSVDNFALKYKAVNQVNFGNVPHAASCQNTLVFGTAFSFAWRNILHLTGEFQECIFSEPYLFSEKKYIRIRFDDGYPCFHIQSCSSPVHFGRSVNECFQKIQNNSERFGIWTTYITFRLINSIKKSLYVTNGTRHHFQ